MKIVILGTAFPLRGGIAHYIGILAGALGRHHEVETITFKRQYPTLLFPGKTQQENEEGLHPPPAPQRIDSINPFNWISVAREVRRRKPDLLIFKYWLPFFGPCFGTIAALAKRGTATKVLFICDNVIPHERRPFDILFTRYAFARADYFVVQSKAVERELLEFLPGALYREVPHPVYSIFGEPVAKDVARATLGLTAQRVLLFFGYVRAYKGLDLLLDALVQVVQDLPAHLLVVGEFYDDESKYRMLISTNHLDESVSVVSDYVPNDRVRLYFSAADAVVLPYRSATQSGIAQIAFNFDRPVIATDVGGLAEIVQHGVTGLVVPPDDPRALAAAILAFYREGMEDRLARNVREKKKNYTWDALVAAIEDLCGPSSLHRP
jgi:D-inositol-3-phosphate glycosyltransferase